MSQFTITAVEPESREWQGKYGPMLSYQITIDGDQGRGEVELAQKPETPAPVVGQSLEGEIENGPRGAKFRKARPAAPGGVSAGQGRSAGGYGKSDRERREIARNSAQSRALELLALEIKCGFIAEPTKVKASELLLPRIEFFANDILNAGKQADS